MDGQAAARLRQHGQHLVQDEQAALERLGQRLFENLEGQAVNFDIHLQRGNAVRRARNLEVHVAQVIFDALDVAQDGVAQVLAGYVTIRHETHCDAGNRRLDRHACIHERQRAAADGGHRGRAVGGQRLRHQPQRVREGFLRRDHRFERAFGQRAVADFAAPRAAVGRNFARREGREVVVVHVALGFFRAERVQRLRIARRAERCHGQDLGFAAGEQAAAMHAREDPHLDRDGPDFGVCALVRAHLVAEDAVAHDLLLDAVERRCQCLRVVGLAQRGDQFGVQRLHCGGLRLLGERLRKDVAHAGADPGRDSFLDDRVAGERGVLELGLADFGAHAVLQLDDRLHGLMAQPQRLEHHVLG